MAKSVVINETVYSGVPGIDIPLSDGTGDVRFYDTSDDDMSAADLLAGKTGHGAAGEVNGTMTNNGGVSGTISTKDGTYTIQEGYHDGTGSVGLSAAEVAKIIADNIKAGVTILGQAGKASVVDTDDADATAAQILNGKKAYVNGALVTGSLTVASVSQDSTTKILRIS